MSMNNLIIQNLLLPAIFVILFFAGCDRILDTSSNSDNKSNQEKDKGLYICPINVEYTSDLSYQHFNIENVSIVESPIISNS